MTLCNRCASTGGHRMLQSPNGLRQPPINYTPRLRNLFQAIFTFALAALGIRFRQYSAD